MAINDSPDRVLCRRKKVPRLRGNADGASQPIPLNHARKDDGRKEMVTIG
jgi:hypothetical protein